MEAKECELLRDAVCGDYAAEVTRLQKLDNWSVSVGPIIYDIEDK